jgi:hypothetical protein
MTQSYALVFRKESFESMFKQSYEIDAYEPNP